MMTLISEVNNRLFERLRASDLYVTYQHAFRTATGLPLRLVDKNLDTWCLDSQTVHRSNFCETINQQEDQCRACLSLNKRLMESAGIHGSTSMRCFAGMTATAVPVKYQDQLVGFLKTGQVFNRKPTADNFDAAMQTLSRYELRLEDIEALRQAYLATRTVESDQYHSMVFLLTTFAEQLGQHVGKLVSAMQVQMPEVIIRAVRYIEQNLSDPISLPDVAKYAGVSRSHFCRLFKEHFGLTFTDYVNQQRIEWAKRELVEPDARISEIAYRIGFQSLSQFNRSFSRFTGVSPSQYRTETIG